MDNKKKFGQFFTNPIIAEFMTKIAIYDDTINFLDPAAGPGVFVQFANKVNSDLKIDAYEIDHKMILNYNNEIKFKTNLINEDFLYSNTNVYDSIVCNPPYNKFQEIPDRVKLIKLFNDKYNIKLSGYTNYCIYFLIKCLNSLKNNGRCVFIIPYEFMNAGYGEKVKEYILKNKLLKTLIKFNNGLKLFDDAMTTSCILIFENCCHDKIKFIDVSDIEDLDYILTEDYDKITTLDYSYDNLNFKEKWSKYFETRNMKYNNLVDFKKIAQVKRGIATGNNNFFSLNKSDILKNSLSEEVCIPCVSKSPDITEIVMTKEYFDSLVQLNKKMFVFDGRNKKSEHDEAYIKYGETINVDKSYLNSHRTPWYGIEDKKPAPIWISVFSRNKLKVIRNEMMISNLTTFHGIYLKENYEKYTNVLFCYLQTPIAQKILKLNKREYGEGLDKFEPNDINNSLILDFSIISLEDITKINDVYSNLLETKNIDIDNLNNIFLKYIEE